MRSFRIEPVSCLRGEISPPADKSISHRAIFISSLAEGKTLIRNFSFSKDCLYTVKAFKEMGVRIIRKDNNLIVYGRGLNGLLPPKEALFVGDSGTTIRLLCGILAGQRFSSVLKAGPSLSKRPMRRVLEPLRMMGAHIKSLKRYKGEEYPPLHIRGTELKAIDYTLMVASAQVKSAILLAGLYAKGITSIREPIRTRDHTERLLRLFAVELKREKERITLNPPDSLRSPQELFIPADISSAAFFIVGAIITENSFLKIKDTCLNPTRLGLIYALKRMGADIEIRYKVKDNDAQEPRGDILVRSGPLKAVHVKREQIPSLIDELPILMVACCFAKGKSIIESAGELRFKETDRIKSMQEGLSRMGAKIYVEKKANEESIIIEGTCRLKGAFLRSFGDHRTAMSLIVAGLSAEGSSRIDDIKCVDKSFPDFLNMLEAITC